MTARDNGQVRAVRVVAPSRLHLGFLDPAGALGRRFGSIGLALEEIATTVTLRAAARDSIRGPEAGRVAERLAALRAAWSVMSPVAVTVEQAIPAHAGLGSGTQLGLALGAGLARLHGLTATPEDMAAILDRGMRSGIGVAAFAQGGFLVDGGKVPEDSAPPPVTVRLPFPEAWRVLLVLDPSRQGLHGMLERAAFSELPPFPADRAAQLCHLALMRLLPAVARAELAPAADALAEIQRALGDHFAPFQGGGRFTSPDVAEAMAWLAREGALGEGQSSWGPTGFTFLPDAGSADRLATAGGKRFAGRGLVFRAVRARNRPAEVVTTLPE
jgi:beta-ribofuranosylaminobenzene 5'-phosphate synthase